MLNDFLSEDAPFVVLYGPSHIIYLLFCIVIVFLFTKNYKYVREHKNKLEKFFLVALAIQQVFFLYGWYAFFTDVFWSEGLPLQLCRVASLFTIIFLINSNRVLLDMLIYFSLFALISLFYPLQVYNFLHISGLSYMINHLITVLIPIFAMIAYGWRPSWSSYRNAIIGFAVYFTLAVIANTFTGGNYFYQTNRPFLHELSTVMFAICTCLVVVVGYAILTKVGIEITNLVEKQKTTIKNFR